MKVTKQSHYYQVIEDCYREDPELIAKWHILSGLSLPECAKDTERVLLKDGGDFLVVYENDELIGYFGQLFVTDNYPMLTTIFVRPKFRNKNMMSKFWSLINRQFNNKAFFTAIYKKNERAAKFFAKHCDKKSTVMRNGKLITLFSFNLGE